MKIHEMFVYAAFFGTFAGMANGLPATAVVRVQSVTETSAQIEILAAQLQEGATSADVWLSVQPVGIDPVYTRVATNLSEGASVVKMVPSLDTNTVYKALAFLRSDGFDDSVAATNVFATALGIAAGGDLPAAVAQAKARIAGDVVSATLRVGPGEYAITSKLVLDAAVRIVSTDGPAATTIRQTATSASAATRIADLSAPGAELSGLTLISDAITYSTSGSCVGISVTAAATVTNCTIIGSGTTIGRQNLFWDGGGLHLNHVGALAIDCIVTNFSVAGFGSGVYLASGTLRNSEISGCTGGILDHAHDGGPGAGLYMTGGTAENCFIHDNRTKYWSSAGVCMTGGTLANCVIVRNRNLNRETAGVGVVFRGGVMTGCTVSRNVTASGRECNVYRQVESGIISGLVSSDYQHGSGNLSRDPVFADEANGDLSVVDSFTASAADLAPGAEATFTADVADADTYAWTFGDGATGSGRSVAHAYANKGLYTVTLTYEKGAETVVRTRPGFIRVYGEEVYLAPVAGHVFPYDTPGTAATNVHEAVKAANLAAAALGKRVTLHVASGNYALYDQLTFDEAVAVRGAGPDTTRFIGTSILSRGVFILSPEVELSGVAVKATWASAASTSRALVSQNGIGIFMTAAGAITNCLVYDCKGGGQNWVGNGGGIYATAGWVVDTTVSGNTCGANGTAVYLGGSALMDRCVITNNASGAQHSSGPGVGVYLAGSATVRNSLVANNRSSWQPGAGVYLAAAGATLENCTVVSNRVNVGGSNGAGVRQINGKLLNSIIYGNLLGTDANDVNKTGGTAEFCCSTTTLAGNGNITQAPLFADYDGADYHLTLGSAGIDIGTNTLAAVAGFDLDRGTRVLNGTGVGEAVVDMGCYEFMLGGEGLSAIFSILSDAEGLDTLEAEFSATVFWDGVAIQDLSQVWFSWDFGDGDTLTGYGLGVVTNLYVGGQRRTVSLTVTYQGETTEPFVKADSITVYADTAYVAAPGASTPAFPYSTPATATTSLLEAYNTLLQASQKGAAMCHLYPLDGAFSSSQTLNFDFPCEIRGLGRDRTTLQSGVTLDTFIKLAHADTLLSGCHLTGASSGHSYGGAVAMTAAGIVSNCLFIGNTSSGHGFLGRGGAIYANAGRIVDCEMSGNGSMYNTTVYLDGFASIDRCVITNNIGGYFYHSYGAAGLTISGGYVTNRNLLVAYNLNLDKAGAGVQVQAGYPVFENCTIVSNRISGGSLIDAASPAGFSQASREFSTVRNCILANNLNEGNVINLVPSSYLRATYSCAPELTSGEGNRPEDPRFKNVADGNYHLKSDSPCVGTGQVLDWMAQALDLGGEPRLNGLRVDMGCYKALPIGSTLVIR